MAPVVLLNFFPVFCLALLTTVVNSQITFNRDSGNRAIDNNGGTRVNIIFDETPPQVLSSCRTPDEKPGTCKSLAECAIFFAEIPTLLETPCSTTNGLEGVCCPDKSTTAKSPRPGQSASGVLASPPAPRVVIPDVSQEQLLIVVDNSIRAFTRRQESVNKILFEDQIQVAKGSPSASHQRFFTSTNDILDQGDKAQLNIEASTNLVNDLKLSKLQGTFALPHISARNTPIANTCPPLSSCVPGFPYRTMDGSCNNMEHPDLGKAGTAFQRILAPKYGDGVNSPRTHGLRGTPLPSARFVSSSFIPDENRPDNNITLMLMQWGQFLDHDLTHTPIVKGANQTSISCCQNGRLLDQRFRHPDCFPIEIPRNDNFYSLHGQQCMDFVRSLPAPRRGCNFGPREQMSQITSYIDGSNIYGSSDAKARSLREFQGGRLKSQRASRSRRELLPASPFECSDEERRKFCFSSGDVRVNEQIDLAVMHTVWLREHNRIANSLQSLNPSWSDEILYQETRRIVIAEMEHVTYNEFLPLVLGPEYMRTFQLAPVSRGHTALYNPEVDPSITNAFATAAYRFGHSLVQGTIHGFNQFGSVEESFSLTKTQFQPFPVYDNFDSFVRGLATQECQRFDNFLSDALTKHLFQGSSAFGLDLGALNIQRGRDHGLPGYNDWREVCGLPRANSWDDLFEVMNSQAVRTLERLYDSVDDIDLFVGALGERPLDGAILGPVFVCLVGDQFARLRRGDRFFYEEKTGRFTEAQLDQIRKVSLARVLCDNSDDITVIQPLVMQKASVLNRRLPCSNNVIPAIDLTLWREFRRNRAPDFSVQNLATPTVISRPSNFNFRPTPENDFANQNFVRPTESSRPSNFNFRPTPENDFSNQNFARPTESSRPSNSNFRPIPENERPSNVIFRPINFSVQQANSASGGFARPIASRPTTNVQTRPPPSNSFGATTPNLSFTNFVNQFGRQQPRRPNDGRQTFGSGK